MKLKHKLFVTFISIAFIPLTLVTLTAVLISNYQIQDFKKQHDMSGDIDLFLSNSIQLFHKLTGNIQSSMEDIVDTEPDKFKDEEFLLELNEILSTKYSFLIVRKGENYIFSGTMESHEKSSEHIYYYLPKFGDHAESVDGGIYVGGENQYLIKQMDFVFSGGENGSAFIVTTVNDMLPEIKVLISKILFISIFILIVSAVIMLIWLYRVILKPLHMLSEATKKISEGNLDFTLEVVKGDEIGRLFKDFDNMRLILKDSAEEKLQYDKDNKELISNISHDLKTPITAIKGYVEGIMDGVASSPEKFNKYIKTIYNKANDMDRLIDELTFYSKIDTDKIPYTFAKINVSEYVMDCVEELALEMDSKGIIFEYLSYVDKDTMIIADTEQIKRAINNIVGNSVKYMDKDTNIIIMKIKEEGDFVHIIIEDNGKGISQVDIQYIFDRFYRTDSSRNSLKGGSGIGLSIVKKIIEDHGGKIWASSKIGIGTELHFVLRKYYEVITNEENIDN
jgi:Signal transduction histidine kinase